MPGVTAQVLPGELQAAYVLCLGGYQGGLPLEEFAWVSLRCISAAFFTAVLELPCSEDQDKHLASDSLIVIDTARF